MSGRQHARVPVTLKVRFRGASSLLVAYSVNLSRGGIFLATDHLLDIGSDVTLNLEVPGEGSIRVDGVVQWARENEDETGPRGIAIQFDKETSGLDPMIDRLVSTYTGLTVMIFSADEGDRKHVKRMVGSIVSTADVVAATSLNVVKAMLGDEIDLLVIDVEEHGSDAYAAIAIASGLDKPVPCVALTGDADERERSRAAGALEICGNPPAFAELRVAVVRALGQPVLLEGE